MPITIPEETEKTYACDLMLAKILCIIQTYEIFFLKFLIPFSFKNFCWLFSYFIADEGGKRSTFALPYQKENIRDCFDTLTTHDSVTQNHR